MMLLIDSESPPSLTGPTELTQKKRRRRRKRREPQDEHERTIAPSASVPGDLTRNQKKNLRKRRKRARELAAARTVAREFIIRPSLSLKHAELLAVEVARAFDLHQLPVSSNGFIATDFKRAPHVRGYHLFKWEGLCVSMFFDSNLCS